MLNGLDNLRYLKDHDKDPENQRPWYWVKGPILWCKFVTLLSNSKYDVWNKVKFCFKKHKYGSLSCGKVLDWLIIVDGDTCDVDDIVDDIVDANDDNDDDDDDANNTEDDWIEAGDNMSALGVVVVVVVVVDDDDNDNDDDDDDDRN